MSDSVQKTVIKFSSVVGVKEEYCLGTRESPKASGLHLGPSRLPDGVPGPSISSFPDLGAVGFNRPSHRSGQQQILEGPQREGYCQLCRNNPRRRKP